MKNNLTKSYHTFFFVFVFTLYFSNVKLFSQTNISAIDALITGGVYLSENTLVAVGERGLIKKTTDNGATWQTKQTNTFIGLNAVVSTSNRVIAFGEKGTILYSTDKGENWQKTESPTKNKLRTACKFTDNEILVLGDAIIMRSSDGGKTFTEVNINSKANWYKVAISGLNSAVSVSYEGQIIRTTDAGKNWVVVIDDMFTNFYDVDFYNDSLGIVCGDKAYITKDGGKSWQEHINKAISRYPTIKFLNDSMIIGNGGYGNLIIISKDTGKTWSNIDHYLNLNGRIGIAIFIKNGANAMMLGNIIAVCDSNFNIVNVVSKTNAGAVDVMDFGDKIYMGCSVNGIYQAVSSDEGETWQRQENCYFQVGKFFRFAQDSIFAVPGNFYSSKTAVGWLSGNRAETWSSVGVEINSNKFTGGALSEISCGKNNTMIFIFERNKLFYSNDRGLSFYPVKVNSPDTALLRGYSGVYMLNDTVGYVCMRVVRSISPTENRTEHKLLKTEDEGRSWNEIYTDKQNYADTNLINSIYFMDKEHGFMVGGTKQYGAYYKETKDGGKTWESRAMGADVYNKIKFSNKKEGFMLGNGLIKKSTNGGETWEDYKLVKDEESMSLYNYKNYELSDDGKRLYLFAGVQTNSYSSVCFKIRLEKGINSVDRENGIDEIAAMITPNPARGRALLGIEQNSGGGVVLLYNTLGQEVQRVEFGNVTNISLDLNGLSAGCYNAVIKTKRGVAVKKIIVN